MQQGKDCLPKRKFQQHNILHPNSSFFCTGQFCYHVNFELDWLLVSRISFWLGMSASVIINSYVGRGDPKFSFCPDRRQQWSHQFQFLAKRGLCRVVLVDCDVFHFGLDHLHRWFIYAYCFQSLLTSCSSQYVNWLHTHKAIHSTNYYRAYSSQTNFPIVPHYTWQFSFATSLIFFHFPK